MNTYQSVNALRSHPFIQQLFAYNFPLKDDYVIFGSTMMYVLGLRDQINDLDVLVREPIWTQAENMGVKVDDMTLRLSDGNISLGKGFVVGNPLHSLDIDQLIDNAVIVDGIRVSPLEDILKYKKLLNRSKDQKDIALIKSYLK